MIDLGKISLGRIRLGGISLGNLGGSAKTSSGSKELFKTILAKLKKEQPQLSESLVCWYSPNLQGMTNKQLYDAMLVGEYPILRDLSGNGYDMELHGFDGTSASGVDGDGNLVFDGVNDWGCNIIDLPSIRAWGAYVSYEKVQVSSMLYPINISNNDVFTRNLQMTSRNDNDQCIYAINNTNISHNTDTLDTYACPHRYAYGRYSISVSTQDIALGKYIYVGRLREERAGMFCPLVLRQIILFAKELTDTELQWVKTNMLVSQEPKKFVVNLWHYNNGEPVLLGTRRVNNGSEIGELPQFDLSATECTNEWYYDLTLSEDALVYDDDYVESDLNLYCSTMPIYQRMLDELDEVVLEDGTTAREHLVCMYSPKLQGLTKESVLADATLADLSGNGYDMTLYGFTEDEQIIDNDGGLVFDGVDDYAVCNMVEDLTNFTAINAFLYLSTKLYSGTSAIKFGVNSRWIERISISNVNMTGFNINHNGKSETLSTTRCQLNRKYVSVISSSYSVMNDTKINYDRSQNGVISTHQYLGASDENSTTHAFFSNNVQYERIVFNRELTDDEITKVKQILKL